MKDKLITGLLTLVIILIMIIGVLVTGMCQTFDLKEVCGYGYRTCEDVDGFIGIDSTSIEIQIVQDQFRSFKVKQNRVTGRPVKFKYGKETTIELETLGSTSFLTFSEYTTKHGEVIYLFELVRKFAKDDEERTYYTAIKL